MSKLKDKNNVYAVIPFYNDEKTISEIINQTLPFVKKIILVNDGSTDSSRKLIIETPDVFVLDLEKNYGKGFALNKGFEKALDMGCQKVVTLDADLQHDPKYIPEFLSVSEKFGIVIGNRLNDLSLMPFQRRISNKLTSFFLTLKTGQKILDSQCGFRLITSDVLKSIKPKSLGFEAESEQIILAVKKGFRIGFVNIPTIYGDEKSKVKPLKTIIAFIRILFT